MRARFYIDFWPGQNISQHGLFANTNPCTAMKGTKRIAFDVVIPDELIHGPVDRVLVEVGKPVVVEQHDEDPS